MVGEHHTNSQRINEVAEVYNWLNSQIENHKDLTGQCRTCGECCDFKSFNHKLFVTPPELMYLAANLGDENIKRMTTGRCPYNAEDKCSVYEYRFSGCRIFSCKGDKDFQSVLSEQVVKKFKSLCREFQIPYRYTDLATALNGFSAG